jgi:glucose-1-phosphate thymidylyltransferase
VEEAKGLILAGGEGDATGLLPVANKPLLVHGIEALRNAGVREVGVAVSRATRQAVVQALSQRPPLGVDITYIETDRALLLLDVLAAAEDFLGGAPCVAHQGDGLLRDDMRPLIHEVSSGSSDALLLVHQAPGGRAPSALEDRRLLRLLGRTRRRVGGLALAGVHVFGARFMEGGGRARTTEVDGWCRVSDADTLLEANRLVLEDLVPGCHSTSLHRTSVQGRVSVDRTARLDSAVVRGPAVIGAGAVIRDAYIGPYSAIGEGVRIEGAEIEHSIVLPDAVIEHLGGRLEASVVGRGAHVFRDFALPRALRLRVGDGNEVSLA